MACYHPLEAWRTKGGGVTFRRSESLGFTIKLPCGRCIGCRIDRSRQWAVRCVHEASLHEDNCFITLTYAPEFLPRGATLVKRHFQLFMKRLRKQTGAKIRYYHCGEYGDELSRPHYHALLFGFDFADKVLWKTVRGIPIYKSDLLASTWGMGFCSIGAVTFQSAAYVARYIMKKINGDLAQAHYADVDHETGEMTSKLPEYTSMSLKPGIAAEWFEQFHEDVYPHDYVVVSGKKYKTPRFYDKLIKKQKGDDFLRGIKVVREAAGMARARDSTPERLAARERVQQGKYKQLKREIIDET